MRSLVLDVPVDVLSRRATVEKIIDWYHGMGSMKLVTTVYSEFVVQAQSDLDFKKVLLSADLNTPDGVSVLAAIRYSDRAKGKSVPMRIWEGLRVGGEILSGRVGEPVTGVWLFEELIKVAVKDNKKVFLLGGWDNVSGRTATMLLKRFPRLKIEYDEGESVVGTDEETNKRVIEKINKFAPDILFVAYNPVKQEKWLAKHRKQLKVKVGMGVGGTFNEYLGEFRRAPKWMERSGLKWLWRVIQEPRRLGRALRAVLVFPYLVFKNSR